MELMEVIEKRKSYRALEPVKITDDMVRDLAKAASRAPSCNNNQPWRFIFVRGNNSLDELKTTLTDGNYWGLNASMIVAVVSKPDLDCRIEGRDYNWIDTGMALMNLLLKGTEMGLATHPVAGFDNARAKEVLEVPDEYRLLTMIIVGKRSDDLSLLKKEWHIKSEGERSGRRPLEEIMSLEKFVPAGDE